MNPGTDRNGAGCQPPCEAGDCDRTAAFWQYLDDVGHWRPVCEPHARRAHPSLEIGVWLESGYMKPVELDRPDGPPPVPDATRSRAFREEVDEAMGWTR